MIRRRRPDGLLLITQEEHAALAARIASHWGNQAFSIPEPREAVVSAVALHDAGWSLHDGEPTLNGDKRPAAFYELPIEAYTRVWVASVSASAARGGPMAGLIVSWHFSDLANYVPLDEQSEAVQHLLQDFMAAQRTRRQDYCAALELSAALADAHAAPAHDRDRSALYNLSVFKTCDWISLMLCAGELPTLLMDARKNLWPNERAPLEVEWLDEQTLQWTPWPLDVAELTLSVSARRVPDGNYRRADDLQRVYQNADNQTFRLQLVRQPGR